MTPDELGYLLKHNHRVECMKDGYRVEVSMSYKENIWVLIHDKPERVWIQRKGLRRMVDLMLTYAPIADWKEVSR